MQTACRLTLAGLRDARPAALLGLGGGTLASVLRPTPLLTSMRRGLLMRHLALQVAKSAIDKKSSGPGLGLLRRRSRF